MRRGLTVEDALGLISELIMALQVGTRDEERQAIGDLCEELTGYAPTREQLREFIDPEY